MHRLSRVPVREAEVHRHRLSQGRRRRRRAQVAPRQGVLRLRELSEVRLHAVEQARARAVSEVRLAVPDREDHEAATAASSSAPTRRATTCGAKSWWKRRSRRRSRFVSPVSLEERCEYHRPVVHIIGGGLAGCEAAWQAASMGVPVTLHEMRPGVRRRPCTRPIGSRNWSAAIPSAATSSTTRSACSKRRCGGSARSSCGWPTGARAGRRGARGRSRAVRRRRDGARSRASADHASSAARCRAIPRRRPDVARHHRHRAADVSRRSRPTSPRSSAASISPSSTRSARSCWPRRSTCRRCFGRRDGTEV